MVYLHGSQQEAVCSVPAIGPVEAVLSAMGPDKSISPVSHLSLVVILLEEALRPTCHRSSKSNITSNATSKLWSLTMV